MAIEFDLVHIHDQEILPLLSELIHYFDLHWDSVVKESGELNLQNTRIVFYDNHIDIPSKDDRTLIYLYFGKDNSESISNRIYLTADYIVNLYEISLRQFIKLISFCAKKKTFSSVS